ncbi:MAG TPA: hypothetical protein VLN25_11625 [Burkholderiaceae bacterium]|nr:hypothetical protein [Burkholderiaceae bacterium]
MNLRIVVFAVITSLPIAVAMAAPAADQPAQKPTAEQTHRNEDIAKHRQMARAHEEAAKCLEAGGTEKQCQERLREACKGIAVGQYCGMRHAH